MHHNNIYYAPTKYNNYFINITCYFLTELLRFSGE